MIRTAVVLATVVALGGGVLAASPAAASSPPSTASAAVADGGGSTGDAGVRDLGDDGIPVASLGDTMRASRERAAAARASGASGVVDHVYVAVVDVTRDASDNDFGTDVLTDVAIDQAVSEVSDYWNGESNGLISMAVSGIERTSLGRGLCDPGSVFSSEEQSAFGGRFANGRWASGHDHLLILSKEDAACGGDAFGYVGAGNGVIFSANGVDDQWGVPILRHEFGHNLGFDHADSAMCRNSLSHDGFLADYTYSGTSCPVEEYGDLLDIMGYSTQNATQHLSSIEKIRAGWLTSGANGYEQLSASATVTLSALDADSGLRAVRVTDQRSGESYVVEYRRGTGGDATSWEFGSQQCAPVATGSAYQRCYGGMDAATGGIRILRDLARYDHQSAVLAVGTTPDAPASSTRRLTFLVAGQTFRSVAAGFSVTVVSLGGDAGARVTVTIPPRTATTTTLTTSRSSQTYGSASRATLVAHVRSIAGAYPHGQMGFYDGSRRIATVTVSGSTGNASFTLPASVAVGTHRYSATFLPSHAGYLQSTSAARTVTVAR